MSTFDRAAKGAALAALAGALGACSGTRVAQGECQEVYGAEVCTFAELAGGEITAVGVSFPLQSARDAPDRLHLVWPPEPVAILALPEGVAERTGFTHFELNWEHEGHQPAAFQEPHFDFHFYTVASEQLEGIHCDDATKPAELPPGYVLPDVVDPKRGEQIGLCVPAMGMHAMPITELERSGPFTATMLLGYYGGHVVFVEPMVSRAELLRGRSFALDVPSLAEVTEGGPRPTRFVADFDEATETWRLKLTGFVER
ncbi:MAG TPA: hypothetical protein VFQ22_01745 [Longimicrobiales bacterium]|nr:hypothetical protein [Longimicrobiales bacterium]